MEIFFYCQACDQKITSDQLALLNEGKCPHCESLEGFSTASRHLKLLYDLGFLDFENKPPLKYPYYY